MNHWSGIGNLTRDPESSFTDSGVAVCKFTIAVNRPKDENGQQRADFIPVRAYNKRASLCREYLRKGRKVGVVGKLQTYTYTDKEGIKRSGFEILLSDLTFLPSSDTNRPNLGDVHSDDGAAQPNFGDSFDDFDDEKLPF